VYRLALESSTVLYFLMDNNLRVHVGFEDNILFRPVETTVAGRPLVIVDDLAVGKIVGGGGNILQVAVA